MLEIVPINIEGWHVVITPISVVTSIKSMVYTCLSDESVLVGDLPNTENRRRELLSENLEGKRLMFCAVLRKNHRNLPVLWRHSGSFLVAMEAHHCLYVRSQRQWLFKVVEHLRRLQVPSFIVRI